MGGGSSSRVDYFRKFAVFGNGRPESDGWNFIGNGLFGSVIPAIHFRSFSSPFPDFSENLQNCSEQLCPFPARFRCDGNGHFLQMQKRDRKSPGKPETETQPNGLEAPFPHPGYDRRSQKYSFETYLGQSLKSDLAHAHAQRSALRLQTVQPTTMDFRV